MKRLCISKYWFDSYKDVNDNISSVTPQFYKFLENASESCDASVADTDSNKTIKFLVTMRTDTTNELIVPRHGMFYSDCTSPYPEDHPIYDMVLLSAQKLVYNLFDCGEYLPQFIQRTTLYPVGACIVNDEPYVYVNVVIDHTLLKLENFKLRDCSVVKIQDVKTDHILDEVLLNSLAIVKGGN